MTVSTEALERYKRLLDDADSELLGLYDQLGSLADRLEPLDPWSDNELDDLMLSMALNEIRHEVMAARHRIHGGMTEVVRARSEIIQRQRRP